MAGPVAGKPGLRFMPWADVTKRRGEPAIDAGKSQLSSANSGLFRVPVRQPEFFAESRG